MNDMFLHERIYRGDQAMEKLATPLVTICGAGAIGSNLANNLARQGFSTLRVIDFDRVDKHNINTQTYGVGDVGALKVDVLKNHLFRTVEIEIDAIGRKLEKRTARKFLKNSTIVVDTLDNSESRQLVQEHCRKEKTECLHVGLFADYLEVIWDDKYKVPNDGELDVCEYPLARNLVLMSVALASEALIRYLLQGEKSNLSFTLRDFSVSEIET